MFLKATNGQVNAFPYSIGNLRRDNPNTSFPRVVPETTMTAYNMFPVEHDVNPTFDPLTHKVEIGATPVLTGDKWVLPKTAVALTPVEIASMTAAKEQGVRKQRNTLLTATDYFALTDVPMNAEMTTYRQALRDITVQTNFPYSVVWPTKP